MALYAVEAVGDGIEATKAFLFPVERSRWLRLALVVFFVGGLGFQFPGGVGNGSVEVGTEPGDSGLEPGEIPSNLPDFVPTESVWLLVGGVVAVGILLKLLFDLLGAVMEFVFVESLRRDQVRLRAYVGQHWRAGLRLFAFRLAVSLLGLAVIAAVGVALFGVFAGGLPTSPGLAELFAAAFLLLPVVIVVGPLVALLNGFTTAFVVPIMLAEDRTVLGGWRRFWPTLRGQPIQYGAYILVGLLLTIATGVIAATTVGLGAILWLLPFGLVGIVIVLAAGGELSLAVGIVLVVLALLYLVCVLALLAAVQVPLQTFLRLYSLLILGDTNDAFDVIPDLRAVARE